MCMYLHAYVKVVMNLFHKRCRICWLGDCKIVKDDSAAQNYIYANPDIAPPSLSAH